MIKEMVTEEFLAELSSKKPLPGAAVRRHWAVQREYLWGRW